MQTGQLRAFLEKSSAAVIIFSLGVALGVVSFMQAPRAHAALGNDIVCFVYSQLNGVGSPIPYLSADGCPSTPPSDTGTIKVVKVVSGGSAQPSSFTLHLKNPSTDVGGSPQPGSLSGTSYIGLPAGAYVVSEDAASNYTASFSASCPAGVITLVANSTVTCTVTNTYTGGGGGGGGSENTLALCSDGIDNNGNGLVDLADPDCAAFKPKLTVTVVVSGGTLGTGDFPLFLDGLGITSGTATTTTTGSHTVTQTGTTTYTGAFSGDCDSSGHVTLAIGDTKSCTLTNTFAGSNGGGDNGGGGSGSVPQCRDGVDNDGDGLIDSADPGCHSDGNANNPASYDSNGTTETNTTNGGSTPTGGGGGGGGSLPQCQDGQDNDHDGFIDAADPGCHNDGNPNNAASYENNWNDESKTFTTGNGPISVGGGEVLGTSTEAACGPLITTYMRLGQKNDAGEVKKLQTFLNQMLGTKLPVTGFFGSLTDKAVRSFQVKYNTEVLTPWVPYGLPSANTSTGYVYKTTQRMINNLYCSTLNLALPTLP